MSKLKAKSSKLSAKAVGLDGSRAFLRYRTGIEEYSYQVIKHLREVIGEDVSVRLYVRKKLRLKSWRLVFIYPDIDFPLPNNWQPRGIWAPRFWTQVGLSLEMLFFPVDTLFVPAHTLPFIGGKYNVVTVHGLEYEMSPQSYGFWERLYMRLSIRYSCQKAETVIAVSENTKQDLMGLYKVAENKILVIGEGYPEKLIGNSLELIKKQREDPESYQLKAKSYILFIGRIEERKNVERIVEAFEILKSRYQIPHRLVLVGKQGYGYEKVQLGIQNSEYTNDIEELGYVTEACKQQLLRGASVFVFPSLYEGFGLPVLEAQAVQLPVVTSKTSSLPEVGGDGAIYVDPLSSESIAEGIYAVFQMSEEEKGSLQEKMIANLARFSWEECAKKISYLLQ
jgi:glycosyltransferase involved in cell wall biosynthesis